MLNKQDYLWCTRCTIYVVVNMIEDRRVYITSAAGPIDVNLAASLPRRLLANEGKTECLSYSINEKNFNQVYHLNFFQGAADIFMARRTRPSSKNSAAVKLLSESMYPQQAFIITYDDRVSWGSELGTYFLCA